MQENMSARKGVESPLIVSGKNPEAGHCGGGYFARRGIGERNFAAYHFNNTAPLGLVGNVLAEPAIALLVMPFAVFGLVLMPLQLDWVPLQIMGWGIFAVRHIAAFVAAWSPDGNPGAMPALTLVLWTIALVLAVVLSTRLKALALPSLYLVLLLSSGAFSGHCGIRRCQAGGSPTD